MLRLAMSDEEQIRDLIQRWMMATKQGDVKTVLDLMTDDVVFMVAGQARFGRTPFENQRSPRRLGPQAADLRARPQSKN